MGWGISDPGVAFSWGSWSNTYTANYWVCQIRVGTARSGLNRYIAVQIYLNEHEGYSYYPYNNYSASFDGFATYGTRPSGWGQGTATIYYGDSSAAAMSGTIYIRGWNNSVGDGANDFLSAGFSIAALPSYTISYNANGGTGTTASQTHYSGIATTISANGFTRTGYSFVKWNTKADGSGTDYAPGASYNSDANLALYAIWKQDNIPVYVNVGGTIKQVEKAYVNMGGVIKEATIYANVGGTIKVIT